MNELVEFFGKLFRLDLWIESFRSLVFAARPRGQETPDVPRLGAQRFVVLTILVVACNITYRGQAPLPSGQTPSPALDALLATAVSGLAVLLGLIFLFFLAWRKPKDVHFALNVVVSHFMLCACLLLILTLIGVADAFDDWAATKLSFVGAENYLIVTSGLFAALCSLAVSIAVGWNTAVFLLDRPRPSITIMISRACLITALSTVLLFAYAMQPVRSVGML